MDFNIPDYMFSFIQQSHSGLYLIMHLVDVLMVFRSRVNIPIGDNSDFAMHIFVRK